MKVAMYSVLVFIGMLMVGWAIVGNDLLMYKFFGPKQEEVRREVFEGTRSFNQGMVQELEAMRFEYVREKDPDARKAMASIILHRVSGYNLNNKNVSADFRMFIEELKGMN